MYNLFKYLMIYILYIKGEIMKIKEFIGSTVLDKNANVVGRVDNVDFDTETGKIDIEDRKSVV